MVAAFTKQAVQLNPEGGDQTGILAEMEVYFENLYAKSERFSLLSSSDLGEYPDIFRSRFRVREEEVIKVMNKQSSKPIGHKGGCAAGFFARMAPVLAPLFTLIFNDWLQQGSYPDFLKHATIVPIFKGGDQSDPANYRPISLLHPISLIFETLIANEIKYFLPQLLSPFQHGFLKTRSTVTNLLSMWDSVTDNLDKGFVTDIIYVDFRKAFDSVIYVNLFEVFHALHLDGDLLLFLYSYFCGRTCQVAWKGRKSKVVNVFKGIPQGSPLGPLLFLMYIDSLSRVLSACDIQHLIFADDIKLFAHIRPGDYSLILQKGIDILIGWCEIMGMAININKTFVACIRGKIADLHVRKYVIGDEVLQTKKIWKDLGVTFQHDALFSEHIVQIGLHAIRLTGFILRMTKNCAGCSIPISFYQSLVRSQLEYAAVIWDPWQQCWTNFLETSQTRLLRVLHARNCGWDEARCKRADWLRSSFGLDSLQQRRMEAMIRLGKKLCQGVIDAPDVLCRIKYRVPYGNLRNNELMYVPQVKTRRRENCFLIRLCKYVNDKQIDLFV